MKSEQEKFQVFSKLEGALKKKSPRIIVGYQQRYLFQKFFLYQIDILSLKMRGPT